MRDYCRIARIAALLLSAAHLAPASAAEAGRAQPILVKSQLIVDTGQRARPFVVETALTDAEQESGLMFRTALAPNSGMIFPFQRSRKVSVWMKDTQVPLDVIFIRNDGTISSIVSNAKPFSTAQMGSKERVGAVLEIPGGRAAELGIRAGDKIRYFGSFRR